MPPTLTTLWPWLRNTWIMSWTRQSIDFQLRSETITNFRHQECLDSRRTTEVKECLWIYRKSTSRLTWTSPAQEKQRSWLTANTLIENTTPRVFAVLAIIKAVEPNLPTTVLTMTEWCMLKEDARNVIQYLKDRESSCKSSSTMNSEAFMVFTQWMATTKSFMPVI